MKATDDKNKLLRDYMKLPYTIRIIPEEAGGYFAEIQELPGCMTQGDTIEELMKNIEEAKELWIESALEIGKEIPLPEEMEKYSGKFLVRIPASLHRHIAKLAKKEGVSLNQMVLALLSERVTLEEIKTEIKTAVWKIEKRTKAEYEFKYESMRISQPEAAYDSLSEKKKIPKMKWEEPGTIKS